MSIPSAVAAPLPIEVQAQSHWPLGMSPAHFLRDYWQKKPLLVRQAFPGFQPPITPDELAGLACEECALSRLIHHDAARQQWHVKNGPFDESDFANTGNANWTLLVQDVDKWDADVATLLQSFSFLPSWRVDDIMVSYADVGGGVGAHVDQYDVFLLQGLGQRHWAISTDPEAPRTLRPDSELKQLFTFQPTHEWVLDPGDLLYLPPDLPHDGVATCGPCMTFSIGMRAPSQAELTGDLADYLAARLNENQRYTDPDLTPTRHAGEIDQAVLTRLRTTLPYAAALDDIQLGDWFGCFITAYRNAQTPLSCQHPMSASMLKHQLHAGWHLIRHPWSRLAWHQNKHGVTLYTNGQSWPATRHVAISLCSSPNLMPSTALACSDTEQALLLNLVNGGYLVLHQSHHP